jgi:RNA polymerase sigma-70 factor (ECF subfamily)
MDSMKVQFIEKLYAKYYQALLNHGSYLTGHNGQFFYSVEECVQETFLAAFEAYEHLQIHPNVMGWLRVTLENRIKHRIKKERNMLRRHQSWDDVSYVADISDEGDAIENLLQNEESKKKVEYALSILKPKERDIIILFYLKNKSIKEIATIYRTSQSVIKVQLHRIRQKMKRILDNFIFLLTLLFLKSL